MNIILIQPPFDTRDKATHFPLGLGYVAKALLNAGHKVEIFDIYAQQFSKNEVKKKIKEFNYDIIGISALSTQYKYVKWLASEIKKDCIKPIILGGALPTFSSEVVLKNKFSSIFIIHLCSFIE